MLKRFMGIFVAIAMILPIFPCSTTLAASYDFATSNGSVIVHSWNTNYTKSSTSLTVGYSRNEKNSSTSGAYLEGKTGTSSPDSKLQFSVTTDEAGRYSLWGRVKGTASTGATWLNFNDTSYVRKDINTNGEWAWVKLVGGEYLTAGQKVNIRLCPKNEGHFIDEFIFTNEGSYAPTGIVDDAATIQASTLPATYGEPTITPPQGVHPRVMFKSGDIATITANTSHAQNTKAKTRLDELVAASFSGTVTGNDSSSRDIENKIEANAFYYAIYGDTDKGNKAVTELLNYLHSVSYPDAEDNDQETRYRGCTVFKAAEVYDWCYPLLTSAQKTEIIAMCEGIMSGMEIGYPNLGQGNVTGHGSEAQLLRDMLAFAIAVYDERPDIYKHVMGRIETQIVPTRNYYYKSHSVHQGSSYGYYRFYWDLYAQKLVKAMSGQDLFNVEDMKQVGYYAIYNRRPDGRMFIQGDDASLNYQQYNNHSGRTSFFAGVLFGDEYLKSEYRTTRGSEDFTNTQFNDDRSFNSVFWLIVNDVNVKTGKTGNIDNGVSGRADLPKSRYFGSPNGTILARTSWDLQRTNPKDSDAAAAMMQIGERYGSNHDHLDAGTFQLFYKGMLASDSGVYDSYFDDHDINYAHRTIAHNGLLIYDSTEKFSMNGQNVSNDGGQKYVGEAKTYEEWMSDEYKTGKVLDHEIATDNSYSYIKGDITPAYSSNKASKVVRSMSFLETGNADVPAIMVVYDKVVSKKADQTKKFVLHTQAQPTVSGTETTVVNKNVITWDGGISATYNGRMVMDTLLPANPTITTVGGDGHQYEVNGTNYPATDEQTYDEGGWGRIEITPSTADTSTEFLNVMQVSDGDSTEKLTVHPTIEGTDGDGAKNMVGARVGDNVVMFSSVGGADGRVQDTSSFTVPGGATKGIKVTVFGVKAGAWTVRKNGAIIATPEATEEGGTITFTDGCGDYEITYLGEGGYEALSSDNISTGYIEPAKPSGTALPANLSHATGGSTGARTSVAMSASGGNISSGSQVGAFRNDTGFSCRFAHTSFRINGKGGFQIRVRGMTSNNSGLENKQFMNFKADGTIEANSSGVNFGKKWKTGTTDNKIDIIADVINGVGYVYVDGQLASKACNLQKNGKWHGYFLYTNGTWNDGIGLQWKYDLNGPKDISCTLFNDTAGHIVTLEDVLSYKGISDKLTSSSDPGLILSDSKMENYFIPQGAATVTYPTSDSVKIDMSAGDYTVAAFMMSKTFHDRSTTGLGVTYNVAGKYLHVSFDQTISGDITDTQIRLRSDGSNITDLGFHNKDGAGFMAYTTANNKNSIAINKAFGDKFKIDILIDITKQKAYYFIDGVQIGNATSSLTKPLINDLRYYIKGEGTVTLENCKYRVYSSLKSFDELVAGITGQSVWWPKGDINTLVVEDDVIGMCVTGKNVFGTTVNAGAKLFAAAFDRNKNLVEVQSWDYIDGSSNEEVVFENAGDIKTIKVFCWETDGAKPLALTNSFNVSDYIQ